MKVIFQNLLYSILVIILEASLKTPDIIIKMNFEVIISAQPFFTSNVTYLQKFSSCSLDSIGVVLAAKKDRCFVGKDGHFFVI